jgi:hypothetical protein
MTLESVCSSPAQAAEATQVASGFDQDHPFQLHLTATFDYLYKEAAIEREVEDLPAGTTGEPIPVEKDLFYKETQYLLSPRIDLGLFTDLQFHAALPIVINDDVGMGFDQRLGGSCIYPGNAMGLQPTCVNDANSTTLRDGLLPSGGGFQGIDAGNPNGFLAGSSQVFRAPSRHGIQKVLLGLDYAIFNEARDDTKPTWTIGVEYGQGVGQVMGFNRLNPTANTGVDDGTNFVKLQTWASRRHGAFDPYMGFFWIYPWSRVGHGAGSPYENFNDDGVHQGDSSTNPRQQAGTVFGFEAIPWEDVPNDRHIAIDLRGYVTAFFQGQGYSEMWEVLADNPQLQINNDGNGLPLKPYPGTTTIENYLSGGVDLAVNGQVGSHAKLRAGLGVSKDQSHYLTFTDAGVDINGNGVVDPDTAGKPSPEVNPAYQPIIDLPGRRYRVEDVLMWHFFVQGEILF